MGMRGRAIGYTQKAEVCISAITGFMPAIPHWGYNGCGRAYWDFIYGGSNTMRIERIMSIIVSSAIFPSPNRVCTQFAIESGSPSLFMPTVVLMPGTPYVGG
jgi:hypothetical protein